jgi:FMN phosphatase YigB (HAD superfamily)
LYQAAVIPPVNPSNDSIGEDYTLSGTASTIDWVKQQVRHILFAHDRMLIVYPQLKHHSTGVTSEPSGPAPPGQAVALYSMAVPLDGDPPATEIPFDQPAGGLDWDDGDDWVPDFPRGSEPLALVAAIDIKVICFDVYGTIIVSLMGSLFIEGYLTLAIQNRQQGLLDVIAYAFPSYRPLWSSEEVLQFYLECEAEQISKAENSSYAPVIHATLRSLGELIGITPETISEEFLTRAVATWQVWADVGEMVPVLQENGFRVVALPNVDVSTFSECRKTIGIGFKFDGVATAESCVGLHRPLVATYDVLSRYCTRTFNVRPDQILLVASGMSRAIEPGSQFGLPTAWLRRNGAIDGGEELASLAAAQPSVEASALVELCNYHMAKAPSA